MANSSFPRSLIPAGVNYSIMVYVVDTMTWALLSELCHDNAQLTNIWKKIKRYKKKGIGEGDVWWEIPELKVTLISRKWFEEQKKSRTI